MPIKATLSKNIDGKSKRTVGKNKKIIDAEIVEIVNVDKTEVKPKTFEKTNRPLRLGDLAEKTDGIWQGNALRKGGLVLVQDIKADDEEADDEDGEENFYYSEVHNDFDDYTLFVALDPERLIPRLKRLEKEAHLFKEEQGLEVLFLALGFLRWRDTSFSKKEHESPLILLPVELKFERKTSTYHLKIREEEMAANLPLQERLRQDLGLTLPDIPENLDEDWFPSTYFEACAQVIASQKDWLVDDRAMQLGCFSFSKMQMYQDLDIKACLRTSLKIMDY